MSVYNGSRYVRDAIESVIHQTFTDFEFIIFDDCSTDHTWSILCEYAEYDKRVKVFRNEENIGLTKSLNKGLRLSHGEYIARQDADDISLPGRLEKQVELLDQHFEVVLVSCDLEVIDADGLTTDKWQQACDSDLVTWYLLFYNHLGGHSQVMFRREVALNLDGYSEAFRYCQDYELWCRLVKTGRIVIMPEVLLKKRMHSESISIEKKLEQEAYYWIQVQSNIKDLTGEAITSAEARTLTYFWTGNDYLWSECFADLRQIDWLQSRLKKTYQAFLQQHALHDHFDLSISKRLRAIICQQLLYMLQAFKRDQRGVSIQLKLYLYALAWSPSEVIRGWLRRLMLLH